MGGSRGLLGTPNFINRGKKRHMRAREYATFLVLNSYPDPPPPPPLSKILYPLLSLYPQPPTPLVPLQYHLTVSNDRSLPPSPPTMPSPRGAGGANSLGSEVGVTQYGMSLRAVVKGVFKVAFKVILKVIHHLWLRGLPATVSVSAHARGDVVSHVTSWSVNGVVMGTRPALYRRG